MRVIEVKPAVPSSILPGADFVDAFQAIAVEPGLDLDAFAIRLGSASPGWATMLLKLRDRLVKPFGLTTADEVQRAGAPVFPMISSQDNRIVLGLDDRHLDFRLVIDRDAGSGDQASITATTLVRTHNIGGRLYLAAVKPFHRMIVPAMLKNALRAV